MNWQRGFFRLWLFVSTLWWAAGALFSDAVHLSNKAKVYSDKPLSALSDAELTALWQQSRAMQINWAELASIVVSPFVILALGAFLGWAIKGFKRSA
jgi:hypothetical protein